MYVHVSCAVRECILTCKYAHTTTHCLQWNGTGLGGNGLVFAEVCTWGCGPKDVDGVLYAQLNVNIWREGGGVMEREVE